MCWSRLILVAAALPLCGCTMVRQAVHNIEFEHTLRSDIKEQQALHRQLAMDAWLETWSASGDAAPEAGYAEGFVDGFADFLDRGGAAEAPPAPPKKFWFGESLSAEGRQVSIRYLKGFADGAEAAQESGLRKDSLVPVVLPGHGPPPDSVLPNSVLPEPSPPAGELPPPVDVGPLPREIGPGSANARRRPDVVAPWPNDPMPVGYVPRR
jgi:hypothetical protein